MTPDFNPETHEYTLEGRTVPSVTQILRDLGIYSNPWAKEHHATLGKAVDKLCDLIDREREGDNVRWDPKTTSPVLVPCGNAYRKFCDDYGFVPLLSQLRVYLQEPSVAGTFDRWGTASRIKPGRMLVEIKSGCWDAAYLIQKALYAYLLPRTDGFGEQYESDSSAVLYLNKVTGEPSIDWGNGSDLQIGLQAVNLWWWLKNHKKLKGDQ